jgi:hypothetical protein
MEIRRTLTFRSNRTLSAREPGASAPAPIPFTPGSGRFAANNPWLRVRVAHIAGLNQRAGLRAETSPVRFANREPSIPIERLWKAESIDAAL